MCGFFGALLFEQAAIPRQRLEEAARVQAHRGPDAAAVTSYELARSRLVLGHQRLSIIDLSSAGNQPMEQSDGAGVIVFNGELYNYLELRQELRAAGERFATRSDTEVLLKALHYWGIESALSRMNWMGAFAWADFTAGRLHLARDPGSEKPLFYWQTADRIVFASELKTLLTLAARKFTLDEVFVARLLRQGLLDIDERSIFSDIRQLTGRSRASASLAAVGVLEVRPYQPIEFKGDPGGMRLSEIEGHTRDLFFDSVRLRLRSDVPVGVLLSGGIDSTAIAAAVRHLGAPDQRPRLLSVVSEDARYSEAGFIDIAASYLDCEVHKVVLERKPASLIDELEQASWYNDVPVKGLSIIAHRRLMDAARQQGLKVILSGQGADELLAGYRKYLGFYLHALIGQGRPIAAAVTLLGFVLRRSVVNQFSLSEAKRYLPGRHTNSAAEDNGWLGERLRNVARVELGLAGRSFNERQALDLNHYSVPDLCHYEDRMSMSHSLEIRLPFLDPRLIDFLLRVPAKFKIHNGWTKYCLRRAMAEHLPPAIAWRKDKQGFSNPEEQWLRDDLADDVRECFSKNSLLHRFGLADSGRLQTRYARFRAGGRSARGIWSRDIFVPFATEVWLRRYREWIA